jgi:hypothetical protein
MRRLLFVALVAIALIVAAGQFLVGCVVTKQWPG